VEAVANIKAAVAQIDNNNKLYVLNQSNFDSQFYRFNAFTDAQIRQQLGLLPLPQELSNTLVDLTLKTIDNRTIQLPPQRSKRAVSTDPRCQNLPAYKNWVEEGKTTPVRDQGQCGMFENVSKMNISLLSFV
jgi:C1A family cysteine protease